MYLSNESFLTMVRGGESALNPPTGSLGHPVTNWRNWRCSSRLYSDITSYNIRIDLKQILKFTTTIELKAGRFSCAIPSIYVQHGRDLGTSLSALEVSKSRLFYKSRFPGIGTGRDRRIHISGTKESNTSSNQTIKAWTLSWWAVTELLLRHLLDVSLESGSVL